MKDMTYCDNCGESLPDVNDRIVVGELPRNIASENAGGSAVLCEPCFKECCR